MFTIIITTFSREFLGKVATFSREFSGEVATFSREFAIIEAAVRWFEVVWVAFGAALMHKKAEAFVVDLGWNS